MKVIFAIIIMLVIILIPFHVSVWIGITRLILLTIVLLVAIFKSGKIDKEIDKN
jgi:Ca2+/Na+ antiporter